MASLVLRLLPAAAILASLAACALPGGQGARRTMLEGDLVAPPSGWATFCARIPEHCATPAAAGDELPAGPEALLRLAEVNRIVNGAITPAADEARYAGADRWSLPLAIDETDLGDCEDYALEKRRLLIEAGWPPHALRLAVATSRDTGVHAALIALTEEGDFVLDNLEDDVRLWAYTDYIWLKRQASDDPREWRRVRYQ